MSRTSPPPADHLPHFKEWQELSSESFTLTDYLYHEGKRDLAVAFAYLFWPTFVEVDGCVLREDRYDPANFQDWMRSTGSNRRQVESVINHLHIYDLFQNDKEYPLEVDEYVAEVLLRTWRSALAEQFPDKKFVFHYATEPDDYGPTIYFWQERPEEQGAAL